MLTCMEVDANTGDHNTAFRINAVSFQETLWTNDIAYEFLKRGGK